MYWEEGRLRYGGDKFVYIWKSSIPLGYIASYWGLGHRRLYQHALFVFASSWMGFAVGTFTWDLDKTHDYTPEEVRHLDNFHARRGGFEEGAWL